MWRPIGIVILELHLHKITEKRSKCYGIVRKMFGNVWKTSENHRKSLGEDLRKSSKSLEIFLFKIFILCVYRLRRNTWSSSDRVTFITRETAGTCTQGTAITARSVSGAGES